MYAAERHLAILEIARADGRVEVAALARRLDVTPATVRRDLSEMERKGLLRRAHGGAIPIDRFAGEPAVADREAVHILEKSRIASAALALLPTAGSVFFDAGTSTARLAAMLPDDCDLTVITHSIPIAATLAEKPGLDLHVVGGHVRTRTLAAVGGWAADVLRTLRPDVAFLGTNGIHPERGLSTPDVEEARVKSAIIRAARRSVVLADASKFGREDLAVVAGVDEIDVVVTDAAADPADLERLRAAGVEVVVA